MCHGGVHVCTVCVSMYTLCEYMYICVLLDISRQPGCMYVYMCTPILIYLYITEWLQTEWM